MTRTSLPNRRSADTREIEHGGQRYWLTVGHDAEGDVAEIFAQARKTSSQSEALARDGAILISIARQYVTPLDVLRHAVTREEDGSPSTVIGAVLDEVAT